MSKRERPDATNGGAAPAGAAGGHGRGEPGKRSRTQQIPPRRPPAAQPSDGASDGDASMSRDAGTSAGNRLHARPARVDLPPARVGASSTGSFQLTNPGTEPVEILDVLPQRRPADVVSTGIETTMLEGGASTDVHLAYTPRAAVSYIDTLLVETDRGPDVGIKVRGRGKASLHDGLMAHDPAAVAELDEVVDTERRAEARQLAHRGVAPTVETYAQLRAAFAQAIEFGKQELWQEAAVLAEAVGDRLRAISHPQRVLELVERHGIGQHALQAELVMCRQAAFDVEQRTQSRQGLAGADYLSAFEQAAPLLRVLTGESDDVSHLRAVDRASLITAGIYGLPVAVVGAVATGGLLLEASPVIVSKISLLGAGAREVFLRVATWINTHPQEAEAWAEVAISVGVEAGEDPRGFYERLQTPEGWFQLATNVFMTVYPARTGRGSDEGYAGPATSGTRARPATAQPGSATPTPAALPAGGAGHAPDPSIEQAATRTHERLAGFVDKVRDRSDARAVPGGAPSVTHAADKPSGRLLEPFVGDRLESARDLARQHQGAQVIAAEARNPPAAEDIARFRAEGGEFLAERFAESLPPASVEKIFVRYPIPHDKGVEDATAPSMAEITAMMAQTPGARMEDVINNAMATRHAEIESITNLAPHAIEKLQDGGTMEVVFWEKEVGTEIHALLGRIYIDPSDGRRFTIEVETPLMSIPRASIPHTGAGIPERITVVSRMTIRKVALP